MLLSFVIMDRLIVGPAMRRRWWVLLLRGILAILFGLVSFAWPGPMILVLTTVFAVYAFIDGLLALTAGLHGRWPFLVILGVIGIIAGLVAFFFPSVAVLTFLFIIGAWAIIRGAAEIATAVQLRKVIANEWSLIMGGIISVLFGVLLISRPQIGAVSILWVIGTYAIIIGALLVVHAFRVRNHPWAV
jgi:uncharacterized membrane protein HdeD (DUF308 family)